MDKEIGKQNRKLKAYRVYKNKTQEDIAAHLGITVAGYINKENGRNKFSLSEAKKLADYFNTTVDELFFDNELHITSSASDN